MTCAENFTFTTVRGVVLDEQTVVKTSVHGNISSSVQGYASGSIGSTTRSEQQFWLETDDGRELHVDFRDLNGTIPLRKGHQVILAYFENRKRPSGLYIENTRTPYTIPQRHTIENITPWQVIISLVVPLTLALAKQNIAAGVAIVVLFGYFFSKANFKTKNNAEREINIVDEAVEHLKRYAKTLPNKTQQPSEADKLE